MKRFCVVLVGLLVLAGCAGPGGGGPSEPPPRQSGAQERAPEKPRLTRRQLVRRANRICADTGTSVERLVRRETKAISSGARTGSRSELEADVIKKIFRVLRSYQRKLRRLRPPEADQAQWDVFNRARTRSLAAADAIVKATRSGDRAKRRRLIRRSDRLDAPANFIVQTWGLKRCAFTEKSFTP